MNKRMLQQAQQLKAQLMKAQQELENTIIEASAGGGAVTVTMNGQQAIQSVKISPDVVDPEDVEMLEDLVLSAVKEAQAKVLETSQKMMGGLTGGLNIPGLM